MRYPNIALVTIATLSMLAGSAIGATAQSEPDPVVPLEFTGTFAAGPCPVEPTTEVVAGVELKRGWSCAPTASMSDPRLEGTVGFAENGDRYLDGSGLQIQSTAISIENEDGVWREDPRLSVEFPGAATDMASMYIFVGEGDYAGMTAVMVATPTAHGAKLRGFIVERELPLRPETASTQ